MNRLLNNVPFLVIALLAVDGLHFVFANALRAYLHPVTSVLYVLSIGTLQVALFAYGRGKLRLDTFQRHPVFFLALGLLVSISTSINYIAVEYIDPGTASLLAQTTILFGIALGVWWLKDRLTRGQLLGAAIALVGVVVITFHPGDYLRLGALLVIGSSALYALHAAVVKRYAGGMDFIEFFVWRLIATTGFLFASAALQNHLTLPADWRAWLILLTAATVDICISRTLYYLSLRRLSVSIHSLILTLSPVVAIIWSLALFGTQPGPRDLIGGLGVLIGIGIVTYRRS